MDIEQRNILSEDNPQSQNKPQNLNLHNNAALNEIFYSLQNDFKNIQIELEEKTKMNKKLFEDFNHLLFYLEKEIEAIEKLKQEQYTYVESNKDLIDEQKNFDRNMLSLNYSKNEYLKQLEFLTKQNQALSQQIAEEQDEINLLEQERSKYNSLNKEMQIKNNEKLSKIKINDDAIGYFQQQLNSSNVTINKMVNMISELEEYYKNLQDQYNEYNAAHKIHENKKFNNDKVYQELVDNIKKKETNINDNMSQLDLISGEKEQLYNYNTKIYNDLDRLQNHIYELAEQNKKLLEKIGKYQKIEEMINNHIMAKKDINNKLSEQQQFIEDKIGNALKNYLTEESQYGNKVINNETKESIYNNRIVTESNNFTKEKITDRNSNQNLDIRNSNSINDIKSINTLNYNRSGDLTLNENNFSDRNYSNLLEQQSMKNISNTDFNYIDTQKELELEHDYE